jgi:hypothetical protein
MIQTNALADGAMGNLAELHTRFVESSMPPYLRVASSSDNQRSPGRNQENWLADNPASITSQIGVAKAWPRAPLDPGGETGNPI